MFAFTVILNPPNHEYIENNLLPFLALDLISAVALIVIGSLGASNVLNILPGGSYAMIGIGCFQLSPCLLGFNLAASKDKTNAEYAFLKLGILDN